jgi:hypothetical protein
MNEKNFVTPNEAFPVAYGLKAADAGKGLCYADRIADAIKKVTATLPVVDGKVVLSWPVARDVINLLWLEFKAGREAVRQQRNRFKAPDGVPRNPSGCCRVAGAAHLGLNYKATTHDKRK